MKSSTGVVLLAGGYGTRLYPLTKDLPKALLPMGQGVVLDWIVSALKEVPGLSRTILVTNHRFAQQFEEWKQGRRLPVPVEIVDDGTSTPETRVGAIRDLLLGLTRLDKQDDVLVLGTDNLFSWSLGTFVEFARTKRPAACIALRRVRTPEEASRCGVVEQDAKGRLLRCVEKPARPASLTVSTCVYYLSARCRGRVEESTRHGNNTDAPGYFVGWLVQQEPVYGFMTAGEWFDIGSQEAYQEALQQWPLHRVAGRRTVKHRVQRRTRPANSRSK